MEALLSGLRRYGASQHSGYWCNMQAKLATSIVFLLCVSGCSFIGGAFDGQPGDLQKISPGALALIQSAYSDLDADLIMDYHTHIAGR